MPRKRSRGQPQQNASCKTKPGNLNDHKSMELEAGRRQKLTSTATILTLADEARNTSLHGGDVWEANTKLRKRPIEFVSAGFVQPSKWTEELAHPSDQHGDQYNESVSSRLQEVPPPPDLFFFDTVRDTENAPLEKEQMALHIASLEVESSRPADQSSDDEVLLFKGRAPARDGSKFVNLDTIEAELQAVEAHIPPILEIDESDHSVDNKRRRGRRGGRKQTKAAIQPRNDEDMLSDYIENMEQNGQLDELKEYIRKLTAVDTSNEDDDDSTATTDETLTGADLSSDMGSAGSAEMLPTLLNPELYSVDPMDWEMPNTRRRSKKGQRGPLLPSNDLDSDMELQIQQAWKGDRMKKAKRKQEREELRKLGLLRKKANPQDLRIKYPDGMKIEHVVEEIRLFLSNEDARYVANRCLSNVSKSANICTHSLCLPPMDKQSRKMIHQLANKFNVKSKSIGKGEQRRPELHRTKRTPAFAEKAFALAVSRIERQYFPRPDKRGSGRFSTAKASSYAETSYKDGDVVGAAAPELGTDNRGRTMLEKMGWSRGTALGTEDNQGILQPVTQTMKRSKAGLG